MSNIEKVCTFLKEAGTYYLATADGGQPRVRPFGTAHIFEDRLYIQTGLVKPCAQQMIKNPKVEICAFKAGTWVRIEAEAVLDERIEAQQSMLDDYQSLQGMYKAGDGNTAVFWLKNAKATFSSFTAAPEVVEF